MKKQTEKGKITALYTGGSREAYCLQAEKGRGGQAVQGEAENRTAPEAAAADIEGTC